MSQTSGDRLRPTLSLDLVEASVCETGSPRHSDSLGVGYVTQLKIQKVRGD